MCSGSIVTSKGEELERLLEAVLPLLGIGVVAATGVKLKHPEVFLEDINYRRRFLEVNCIFTLLSSIVRGRIETYLELSLLQLFETE